MQINGYEADIENIEKTLPPATRNPRKSKQINVTSDQETRDASKPVKLNICLSLRI